MGPAQDGRGIRRDRHPKRPSQANDVADILSNLGRVNVDRPDNLETLARCCYPRDTRANRPEAVMNDTDHPCTHPEENAAGGRERRADRRFAPSIPVLLTKGKEIGPAGIAAPTQARR